MAKEISLLETFFKIPIRIYSAIELAKIEEQRNKDEIAGEVSQVQEAAFTIGYTRIPYKSARELSWADHYTKTRELEDVEEKGFDCTQVATPEGDVFTCAFERKKFEEYYSKYLEKMELFNEQQKEKYDRKYPNGEQTPVSREED
jgi:hypothetical protein